VKSKKRNCLFITREGRGDEKNTGIITSWNLPRIIQKRFEYCPTPAKDNKDPWKPGVFNLTKLLKLNKLKVIKNKICLIK